MNPIYMQSTEPLRQTCCDRSELGDLFVGQPRLMLRRTFASQVWLQNLRSREDLTMALASLREYCVAKTRQGCCERFGLRNQPKALDGGWKRYWYYFVSLLVRLTDANKTRLARRMVS